VRLALLDGPVQRGGLAQAVDAPEARLARRVEPRKGLHRPPHVVHADPTAVGPAPGRDGVVQLDQVHVVPAQTAEARLDRGGHRGRDVLVVRRGELDLGADQDIGFQLAQDVPQVGLGGAVAVDGRGVEVVDAQLDGAADRGDHLAAVPLDEQAADCAAAEADDRDFQAGLAQRTILHGHETPPDPGPTSVTAVIILQGVAESKQRARGYPAIECQLFVRHPSCQNAAIVV